MFVSLSDLQRPRRGETSFQILMEVILVLLCLIQVKYGKPHVHCTYSLLCHVYLENQIWNIFRNGEITKECTVLIQGSKGWGVAFIKGSNPLV